MSATRIASRFLVALRSKYRKLSKNAIKLKRRSFMLEQLEGRALMAVLAAWDFTGEGTTTNNTSAADSTAANLDVAGTLTRGPRTYSSGGNSFRTQGFSNNGISTSNTDYFQTTISASPGFTLSLNQLDARFAGTGTFAASPGVSSQFAYSLDGTTFTLIGSPAVTTSTPATLPSVSLVGITALQNIPDTTTVTIRYYASGQTSTGGWGFNSPSSGTNGFVIDGSVSSSTVAPTVTSPSFTSVTDTEATLGGNVTTDGGATITARGIVYSPTGTNANPLLGGSGVIDVPVAGTTGIFTTPVTGLTASTGYSFKAYATNSVGTTYTSVSTFTTTGAPVSPTVTSPTSTSVTFDSATLGGNVTSDGNSAITARGVVYALTADNSNPTLGGSGTTTVAGTGTTGIFTVSASGLVASSAYSFVAYATNAQGTSYSSVGTFSTPAAPVVPSVTSPTSTGVTATSATLGGNVTSDGNSTITARGVVYSLTSANPNPTIGGSGVTNVAGTGTTGVFTVSATGLTQQSGYSFAAYATNSIGTTYSPVSTFTTLLAPVVWDFGNTDNSTTAIPTTTPNASISNLTRGNINGIAADALIRTNSVSTYAGASGLGNATVPAVGGALNTATSAYFEFTVTPSPTYGTTLSGLSFGSRSTGSGPLNYAIRSSADSYTSDLATGTFLANSAWVLHTPTIAASTASNTAPLTYRIYGFGGSAAASTVSQGSNWRIDDLSLTVSTVVLASPSVAISNPLSGNTKVYDGLAYTATATVTGASSPTPTPTFTYYVGVGTGGTVLASPPINVGTYTVVANTPINSGNNPAASAPYTYSITPATLTITADTQTKTYGATDPTLAFTPSGLVGTDTSAVITGSLARATGENVGTYAITQGSVAAGSNYTINYVGANLSVTAATLTITADAKSKTAGDADPALTYTFSGLTNGDTPAVITEALSRTAGETAGVYPINLGSVSASSNYSITFVGANLTINPAAAAPTLTSVVVNGADAFLNNAQRSMVTSLVVTFSSPVTLTAGAFSITNIGLFTASNISLDSSQILVSANAANNVYTIRFGAGISVNTRQGTGSLGNSLADGNYRLTIDSTKVTGSGGTLNGNNVFGAAAVDNFFRMYGDSNGDGVVNAIDRTAVMSALSGTLNAALDFDGNASTTTGVDTSNYFANNNKRRRLF